MSIEVTVEYAHREWNPYDHVVHIRNYQQLQAKIAELEAEVERLSVAHVKAFQANADSQAGLAAAQEENGRLENQVLARDAELWGRTQEILGLKDQLAAEQLNNKRLRDALQAYIDEHEECQDADDWMAMMCSVEAHHAADEAISTPASTEALDKYVAEKVKDATLPVADELQKTRLQMITDFGQYQESHGQITTLTQQRDLAVEALEEVRRSGDTRLASMAIAHLSTIKESEAK